MQTLDSRAVKQALLSKASYDLKPSVQLRLGTFLFCSIILSELSVASDRQQKTRQIRKGTLRRECSYIVYREYERTNDQTSFL